MLSIEADRSREATSGRLGVALINTADNFKSYIAATLLASVQHQ